MGGRWSRGEGVRKKVGKHPVRKRGIEKADGNLEFDEETRLERKKVRLKRVEKGGREGIPCLDSEEGREKCTCANREGDGEGVARLRVKPRTNGGS